LIELDQIQEVANTGNSQLCFACFDHWSLELNINHHRSLFNFPKFSLDVSRLQSSTDVPDFTPETYCFIACQWLAN
jgi:hypothetical protein